MGLHPQTVVNGYRYTALFCEENIWQLVQALVAEGVDVTALQVIFISNPQRQVVLFNQRKGTELGHVVWDYHVILRQREGESDRIYDFDSLLPFPCHSRDYLEATFGLQQALQQSYRSQLRLVPAADYLQNFYSDRHHMRGVIREEGFPPWPAIMPAHDRVVRLEEYWDVHNALIPNSRVLSIDSFVRSEL
jgi:hypothetical protein